MTHGRFSRTFIAALLLITAALSPAFLALPAGASPPAAAQGVPAEAAAITATAITEKSILRLLDPDVHDRFGYALAIDGQTAVIGVPYDDGPTEALPESGAAYVYVLAPDGRWSQQAVLRSANPDEGDFFGSSVAIDGDTIIVGADYDDGASNSNTNAGAAYVFVRNGGVWVQQTILRPFGSGPNDLIGEVVAIDGDTVVISARQDDGANDALSDAGAAYVFTRNASGAWAQGPTLRHLTPAAGDNFGKSVSIDGEWIAIGAFRDDGPNNDRPDSGSVTIFISNGEGGWVINRIFNSYGAISMEENDHFGGDVALDGNTLVVGAFGDAGPNNNLTKAGAAYVYTYIEAVGTWSAGEIFRAANPAADEYFGGSVAISGNTILVSASQDDGPGDAMTDSGAVHVYIRQSNQWIAETTLRASNADEFDWFGESLAISGGFIMVGASLEESGRVPVAESGAAYVFFRSTAQVYVPLIRR